jgi:hypothetical protein
VDWVLSDAADTSASHARGSTSFILAVYAVRRTIPNRLVFLRIRSDWMRSRIVNKIPGHLRVEHDAGACASGIQATARARSSQKNRGGSRWLASPACPLDDGRRAAARYLERRQASRRPPQTPPAPGSVRSPIADQE